MTDFVSGATMLAALAVALFFLRFWHQTRDRLFAMFALAFGVFAASRLVLTLLGEESEARVWVYLLRLIAFVLLLAAIVDKNRAAARR